MSALREWLRWHSIRHHALVPIWSRIPEKGRWRVVNWLNKSDRRCWCDLVDDAICHPESDPCDMPLPSLRGERAPRCASVCDWSHPGVHEGQHDCSCYCGKFRFVAADGGYERRRAE